MRERRKQLGGYLPERKMRAPKLEPVNEELFQEFYTGTGRPQDSRPRWCWCA